MKIKNLVVMGAAAAMFIAGTARADHMGNWSDRLHYNRDTGDVFAPQEFSLDLFGTYGKPKQKFNDTFDRTARGGTFGGGVGANYFLTRCFGLGVDGIAQANGGNILDAVSGSAILRWPIESARFAPYFFGGGGRQFDGPDSWNVHGGVGVEFRLNTHTGLFVDGRHVFHLNHKATDFALLRAGVRLAF